MRLTIKQEIMESSPHDAVGEEPATRTPDNEVPPGNHGGGEGAAGGQQRHSLPSAPRGKPKAPPLIQRKIKPNETDAGVDTAATTGSGSKIPLLKTKQVDRESLGEVQGKMSHTNVRIHVSTRQGAQELHKPRKSKDGKTTTTERVHRSVEKVKISKGIEMNRVVQESNGVTSKRFSSTGFPTTSTSRTCNATSQRSRSADKTTTHKKMTKVEASCQEVKSFTAIRNTRTNVHAAAASGKPAHLNKPKESTSATTTKDSTENQTTLDEKAATDAASNFKTVEEFLKMPETLLLNGNPKKTLYKSKFWEYIDPSGKSSSVSKCKQPTKSYNPEEVKSFMEKQKEVRRLQHIKESKEKQLEAEKRQRILKELDSKCHRLAVKGKHKDETPQPQQHNQNLAVNQAKKRKMELESPSLKYLKPLLEHKHSTLRRRSDHFSVDTAKQAQYLLSEFENIVKRECISFLHRIPLPSDTNLISPIVEKADKAVGTSIAESDSKSEDITITSGKQESSEVAISGTTKKFPSPATVEKAITKIQAFYRGHKVRQALREAKIQLHKPWNKCQESQQQQQTKRRRWSFPKLPEKPYDTNSIHGRLLPMSPVPMAGMGMSSDPLIPCYIPPPPPPASSQASRSPPRPKVLPSSPFTPVKLRVYDDPYPKQVIRSLESPTPSNTDTAVRPSRHSLPITKDSAFDDFFIPTPLPSIVDVLREKIRLFSTSGDIALLVPPEITTERKQPARVPEIPSSKVTDKGVSNDQVNLIHQDQSSQQIQHDDKESDATPKTRRPKRRSRTRSNRRSSSPVEDSTTTADTDLENIGGATQSQSMANLSTSQKQTPNSSCRSESSIASSVVEPSVSSSLGEFLAPALRLRYEAEREHLKIIEKALQVKLHDSRNVGESLQSGQNESPKERGKKASPESDRVQLAIANCHKESMKAAAEMAKWMADFQKSTQHQDKPQQTTVDLAAMVYAAVEEARIMGEGKRREQQLQQALHSENKSNHVIQQQAPPLESSSQNAEDMTKVDKSVETSLTLLKGDEIFKKPEEILLRDPERTGRDYQQQYPSASESERDSPAPVPLSVSSISAHVSKISTVLEDYSNSVMFEKEDESVQQISPPPSTSSTIKSTSVLSEEDEVRNKIPKTDPVLSFSLHESVNDSSIKEAEISQANLAEENEEKSKLEEIQEILSESDIQSDKVLSQVQSPDGSYAVDMNANDDKSNEVSMAPVISNETEDTEKHDEGPITPIASLIPEESLKDDQEQFPSTFESDAESPIPSHQSIGIEIGTNESIQQESISPILSVNDNVASRKSEGQDDEEEEIHHVSPKVSPIGSATYSIESRSLSASPQLELIEDVQEDEHDNLLNEKISYAEESNSQEEAAASLHQNENLESPVQTELTLPNDSSGKNENEVINEDIEESIQIPEEILQDSQQHVSSEFESEDTSQAVSKVEKKIPPTDIGADKSKDDMKVGDENMEMEESESPEIEIQETIEMSIPIMKPPPPYSSPSSLRIPSPNVPSEPVTVREEDIADAEGIHISLNESPQLDPSKEEDKTNRSINASFENEAMPTMQVEQIVANEDSFKDDDEVPVPSSEFFKSHDSMVAESYLVKPETQQTNTEMDIPLKPPPPYSPSSSLDSTSLSSRSLIISLQKDRIERIVHEQVDLVWNIWREASGIAESFPDIDTIMNGMTSEAKHLQDQTIDVGRNGNPDLTQSAIQSFDSLLHHLVYETIKEVLLVENSYTSFIERVRPGPLVLQAQKLKIPKTKESLISSVIKRVSSAIPSNFFTEPHVHSIEKYRGKKWCSRPKELVDEILLEELVEEDYQWTEWWPEQVIVEHIESKEIIKGLISSVLKNRKYVYSQ